ncbi:MAG: threonine/serine exporter family protein [Planctomycetes bacterium]|nr:threonine/serine exporter family protein [Planctomycetota bacterium]
MSDERNPSVALIVHLARALHRYGAPAHRLEGLVAELSRALAFEVQSFSTPTSLFLSFGRPEDQKTTLIRVEPGEVDLAKLIRVEQIHAALCSGRLAVGKALEDLDRIDPARPIYGAPLIVMAFVVACGAASLFFGGGWREMVASAILGAAIERLAWATARSPSGATAFQPLAAFLAAFLAAVGSTYFGFSADVVTLAGLIVLVPGLSLTIALQELAARHLSSGTSRLMGAAMQFLALGFGAALGSKLASTIPGVPSAAVPVTASAVLFWSALAVAPLSFGLLFRAPPRELPWVLLASLAAFGGAKLGTHLVGPELGAFFGAFILGIAGNAYSRWLLRPSAVLVVPGLLLLVPGSLGFRSFAAMLQVDVLQGVDIAFSVAVIAVSLVSGLLVADVMLGSSRSRPVRA